MIARALLFPAALRTLLIFLFAAPFADAAAQLPAPRAEGSGLFGYKETQNVGLTAFTKWTDMLARFEAERERAGEPCQPTRFTRCFSADWLAFLKPLAASSLLTQIEEVNRRMNFAPYITDPRNWGVPDYWATPEQFLRKDGDCEDYSIAKYLSLRELGVDPDRLRVAIVNDLNLGVAHAVLVVYADGETYVLDNQIQQVVPTSAIHHYTPIYSINERAWWIHRP